MQNNLLARVVCKSPYNTNVTELLRELHWLPVQHRITYKVATITYRMRNCQQPGYLLDSLISYKYARTLRSSSSDLLIVPQKLLQHNVLFVQQHLLFGTICQILLE